MSNFRVGQKVVCIDDVWPPYRHPLILLRPVHGEVYTIRFIEPAAYGIGVLLEEIRNHPSVFRDGAGEPGFLARRFRPLIERKTDISIFTEMLNTKETPVKAGA